MSKDLEFLADLHSHTHYEQTDIESKKVILSAYAYLKKRLTPPTEQELCDILSKSIGHMVYYDKTRMLFATSYHLVAQLTVDGLQIGFHFKPHIVTMLGQFFESKVKDNE